jgi:3-phosphoshikimate 1-carboxyvinyltransferase
VDSHGDHRIAMALAVAASAIDEETAVTGWDAVAISYPGFGEELAACE